MIYEVDFDENRLFVREKGKKYAVELPEKLLDFTVDIIKFVQRLPHNREYDVFRYQLPKAAASVGANYEESQAGSYAEFKHRIQVCLRESRESFYWLRVIERLKVQDDEEYLVELQRLLGETGEIKLIFGAISAKTNK